MPGVAALTVGALDWFARKVASSVTDYAAGGRQGPSRAFFVTNTDDCRSDGVHWISVAISMRWDPPPPLYFRESSGTVVSGRGVAARALATCMGPMRMH